MSLLDRLKGKREPGPTVEHPVFGALRYSRHDGWENADFSLWGFSGVQLLIDGGPDGPTEVQEVAFRRFEASRSELLPRCVAAVDEVRAGFEVPEGKFRVSGLTIPPLTSGGEPHEKLWTLWLDLEGDDHFMYGVQTDDEWATVVAFADD